MRTILRNIASRRKGKSLIQYLLCSKGATAIEFAIISPVLLFIIYVEFSFGLMLFESSTLQGALTSAARAGSIGLPDPNDAGLINGPRWNYVQNSILVAQTRPLLNAASITFAATAYPTFEDAMATTNPTVNSVGLTGKVVVYSATYPFVPLPFVKQIFGSPSSITAYAIVKNEPF